MSSSSGSSSSSSSGLGWAKGQFKWLLIAAAILLGLRAGCTPSAVESGKTTVTKSTTSVRSAPSGSGQADRVTSVTKSYNAQVPSGGSRSISSKDGDAWGDPVHIPSGYTICRDADLGNDSFETQNRSSFSNSEWRDFVPSSTGNEERWKSKGAAQTVRFWFVPNGISC